MAARAVPARKSYRMTACASPRAGARIAAAVLLPLLLAACTAWTGGDTPPRTSISIAAPSTIQRPAWLQREVARMDAEAFGLDRLALKLSYTLSPSSDAIVARAVGPVERHAGG